MAQTKVENTYETFEVRNEASEINEIYENSTSAYWGDMPPRKFIIPIWQANQLISQSNMRSLALKVTNIENPDLMSGEWISLNAVTSLTGNLQNLDPNSLNDLQRAIKLFQEFPEYAQTQVESETFFAISQQLFLDLVNGIPGGVGTLTATIGKTADGTHEIFIVVESQLRMRSYGGGASSGARIPKPKR